MRERAVVIVGNGVAGTKAAETVRQLDPHRRVVLVTDEAHPLYNRVTLPHYVKLLVSESQVLMRSAEAHRERGIEFLSGTRVASISVRDKVVTTEGGGELPYSKLLIASGGRPNKLDAPGAVGNGVFNLQYLDDAQMVREAAAEAGSAVAVGGGFIGYEFAYAFFQRNLSTTWLIRGPRFLQRLLEEEGGALVDSLARGMGIQTVYGDEVAAISSRNGRPGSITTKSGRSIEADLVGYGFGLTRNLGFLDGTDVEVGTGVVTDRFLRTNVPDVYAAGDVAEYDDTAIGRRHVMGAWTSAAPHGRVAAVNMLGGQEAFRMFPVQVNPLFHTYVRILGLTPEMDPDLESVWRLELKDRRYRRLFFNEERLVGAVVIGKWSQSSRGRMMDLVKAQGRVRDRQALLDL